MVSLRDFWQVSSTLSNTGFSSLLLISPQWNVFHGKVTSESLFMYLQVSGNTEEDGEEDVAAPAVAYKDGKNNM